MYEFACTFHNLLFSICSVGHGLNQILEYKNVHDKPIYMFYRFFCLCMYLYIHKQNSYRAMKDTINNTECKSPLPSGSHLNHLALFSLRTESDNPDAICELSPKP